MGPAPKKPAQSTFTPRVCRRASAETIDCSSSRSLRSTGMPPSTRPDNVASGPSSTNVVTPRSVSVRTLSANRTASRTCRTQYSGLVMSPSATTGIRG